LLLASPSLLVQSLGMSLLAGGDRRVKIDLDERQAGSAMERTDAVAILPVGADEARHGDNAAVGKQLGHFTDAADVLLAIGRRKAEVFVEAVANIVPVEHVGQPAALDEGVF